MTIMTIWAQKITFYLFVPFSAIIDIILSWKARKSMSFYVKLRYVLKVASAVAWVIVLSVAYAFSWKNPSGFTQTIKSWFGNSLSSPSFFIVAIVIYLSPNMLSGLLFVFPTIRRFLERSDNKAVMLVMWWSQVWDQMLQTSHRQIISSFGLNHKILKTVSCFFFFGFLVYRHFIDFDSRLMNY